MSKIVKSRNLFLEKEELVRWDRFWEDDGLRDFIKRIQITGGIVAGSDGDLGNNFLFTQGSSHLKIALTEDSVAYDTQGRRIFYNHQTGYEWAPTYTPAGTKETWVYAEYGTTSIEEGIVSLSSNGALTGTNTLFTEVFRGQTTLVPNKIRIYDRVSTVDEASGYVFNLVGTYEVTEVTSDTAMVINASAALGAATGDYVYSVVGAFSPGTYDDTRSEEIYQYDFVDIVFTDTDPTGTLTSDQFILCKVTINDSLNTQSIVDLREDKQTFKSDFRLLEKTLQIGIWDMDTTGFVTVSHGLADWTKIRSVEAVIFHDNGSEMFPLTKVTPLGVVQGGWSINESSYSGSIVLTRIASGDFDSASYDDGVMNRGYVTIKYAQ